MPFSTWELPEHAIAHCLEAAGVAPGELDAVAYSYDPRLATVPSDRPVEDRWEGLRTLYAERAPHFLRTLLPGLDVAAFRHVPHHLAHADLTLSLDAAPLPRYTQYDSSVNHARTGGSTHVGLPGSGTYRAKQARFQL